MKQLIGIISLAIILASCGGGSSSGSSQANRCTFSVSGNTVSADITKNSLGFVRNECNQGANLSTRAIRECRAGLQTRYFSTVQWDGEVYIITNPNNIRARINRGDLPEQILNGAIGQWMLENGITEFTCPVAL